MEPVPPKTLKNQLVRLDHNLKQIERSHFAGIQRAPGSLPVLEAFQEFLDNERKKARRRMMTLTGIFVAVLLIAGGGVGSAITWQMKRMAVDYDTVSAQAADLQAKLATVGEQTRSSLETLETRLGKDSQTTRARHDELLAAHTDMAGRVEAEGTRMAEMQTILDRLASENSALKDDLERVMKDWPSVTRQVKELTALRPSRPVTSRPATRKATEKKAPVVAVPPPAKPTPKTTITAAPVVPTLPDRTPSETSPLALTIVPPGEAHGIRWRLPSMATRE